ncbi:MAG: hypothetical protein AB9869_32815 [Verrucomicrobiia bacterium]
MGVDSWSKAAGAAERKRKREARRGGESADAERANAVTPTLRKRFVPRFWEDADQSLPVVKVIKQRYSELREATGADSMQRDLLCQRASFLTLRLEAMEVDAIQGGPFDSGVYVQALNSLLGLLKVLGLDRTVKSVTDLRTYLKEHE